MFGPAAGRPPFLVLWAPPSEPATGDIWTESLGEMFGYLEMLSRERKSQHKGCSGNKLTWWRRGWGGARGAPGGHRSTTSFTGREEVAGSHGCGGQGGG